MAVSPLRYFIPVALLILSAAAPYCFAQRIGSEEYRIYSTVLKDIYSENIKDGYQRNSRCVILNQTEFEPGPPIDRRNKYWKLEASLTKRNSRPTTIENKFASGAYATTYYLASRAEVQELLAADAKRFEEQQSKLVVKALSMCGT